MFKLIIFDMDDTLLHLEVEWDKVKKELIQLAESKGIKTEKDKYIMKLTLDLSISNPELKKQVDEIYRRYEAECTKKKKYYVFEGMIQLIKDLKKKNHLIAICSGNNSETIKEAFSDIGALENIDYVAGLNSVSKGKPDPEPINLILEKLNVKKEDTLFIGNSVWDEIAGKTAKVRTIIIKPNDADDIKKLRNLLL